MLEYEKKRLSGYVVFGTSYPNSYGYLQHTHERDIEATLLVILDSIRLLIPTAIAYG